MPKMAQSYFSCIFAAMTSLLGKLEVFHLEIKSSRLTGAPLALEKPFVSRPSLTIPATYTAQSLESASAVENPPVIKDCGRQQTQFRNIQGS